MVELWLWSVKNIALAIREFSPLLRKMRDDEKDDEIKDRINNFLEFYAEISRKIDRHKLNLTDPNKRFEGEELDIEIDLDDKEIQHLVQLTHRFLNERKNKLKKVQARELKTEKDEDELYRLQKFIDQLEAAFGHPQLSFSKYKELGPIVFPGENPSEAEAVNKIDTALQKIGPQLLEMRKGMHAALEKDTADAGRQAAHSARELIDQVLKEGAPKDLKTRRERASYLMEKYRGGKTSESEVEIVDASWKLIDAEHSK